jgi:hypothetical protein
MTFKFNPITGNLDLDTKEPDNYSKKEINEAQEIPENQLMLYSGDIYINEALELNGEIEEIVDYSDWSFGWNNIPLLKCIRIPSTRDLLFCAFLEINGTLSIEGRLIEVT